MRLKLMTLGITIAVVAIMLAVSAPWAPGAGMRRVLLTPGPDGTGAKGEATIIDKDASTREIIVAAEGLKPTATYTVWVVNMKPKMDMAGVGTGDYAFKSDATGRGQFIGTFPAADLAKWQILEVTHHPDGDPKNMKSMKVVLKGQLNP